MTIDELYLDNIDEFVNDENRIVTYKWLSASLQVHCNVAKQMLYTFLQKKKADEFTVTYFISGLSKPGEDGEQMFKCAVVPQDKLTKYKDTLTMVTSCHVYSVQKSKLKDSNALYMTDFEKFKENVEDCNKYSSIRYDKAVARSRDDMDLLTLNVMPSTETDKKPAAAVTSKPTGKKQATSALASMFAKADQTKKAVKGADVKKEVKEEKKEKDKKSPAKDVKKSGGVMSFFKPTGTKSSGASSGQTSNKTAKKSSPVKKSSPAANKKATKIQDSDDEDTVTVSKRRRVKRDLLDSSSEEEDMEDDSPIPPTPPREPSPIPEPETRADSPVVVEDEDPIPDQPSPAKESTKGGNSTAAAAKTGERKRRRKRTQKTKNYMKDGFMVTEKVWESDSTDASEVEEPVKKAAKVPEKTKSPGKGKKASSPQKSPAKKGAASGKGTKQTSLMSFFKKA